MQKITHFARAYRYDTQGNLTRRIDTQTVEGNTFTFIKDFKRKRDIFITPKGKRFHVQYDEKMQQPVHIKPYGLKKTLYSYDAHGRLTKEQTGSRITRYNYDERGNLQSVTDPLGRSTTYAYDAKDRLIQITYPDGTTERFTYDANGNLITRTVPTSAEHSFAYNGVNKRTAYTDPTQKQTLYTYDKQRRVTAVTKPSGKRIDITYAGGIVAQVSTPEESVNYTYACQSRIGGISKGDERIDYTYDGTLLTQITQSGMLNQSITYSYNNDFLPQSITYAGKTVAFAYNKDNELMRNGDFSIRRDKKGRRIVIEDTHLHRKYLFNRYGELKNVKDDVLFVKLKRNAVGQIVKKRELLGNKKRIYRYEYDEKGRLVRVYRGKGKRKRLVESYSYDANGNRQSATVYGVTATGSYTLDDSLIVYGDNTYRYDEDGYLVEKTTPDGTTTYTYNTLGALIKVTLPDSTIIEYPQDALNRRVARKVNGEIVEKYLWEDLTKLLAVYDGNDNLIWRFEYAGGRMPVAMTDGNGTRYYLHYDQVGSLRAVSDSSGNIVKEIAYDTYGNIIADSNPSFKVPFGFAGGLYDPDTKLTHFGYREYDAYTGKWTAKDPILFEGGDSNLYGYVLNDPVNLVDPEGLKVYLCKLPARAAWGLVDHHWIKTDSLERGMWNAPDTPFPDIPYLADVAVRDQEYEPDAMCREIPNVDEDKVNKQLKKFRPLGKWSPWNNCQTFARDVLRNAGWNDFNDNKVTDPFWSPWVKRSTLE